MSMYWCAKCDNLRDSDDGCEEYKRTQLVCMDCVAEMEEDEETFHTYSTPAGAAEAVRRKRTSSYGEIYETLTKAGCPDDIARELAREKSK